MQPQMPQYPQHQQQHAPYPQHPQYAQHAPAPHGVAPPAGPAKRRPGLIALGIVLVCGGCVGGFMTSLWQEYVDSRGEEASAAKAESDRALENMKYNDDKRPMEARDEYRAKRDAASEAELARNVSAGGAFVGLVGGVALIVVGARGRSA